MERILSRGIPAAAGLDRFSGGVRRSSRGRFGWVGDEKRQGAAGRAPLVWLQHVYSSLFIFPIPLSYR